MAFKRSSFYSLRPEQPLGRLAQLLSKIRVGDGDELLGALAQALALKAGDAVLGDDVVDVVAGHGGHGAGLELGHDAGDGAALGRREQGVDATAAAGEVGPYSEVQGAAGAGVRLRPQVIDAELAG